MKKKLFLVVAIMIVVVIACMSLVACGGNNGNNGGNNGSEQEENIGGGNQGGEQGGEEEDNENVVSPDATITEFLDVWKKSSKKIFTQSRYKVNMVIHSNIFMQYGDENRRYLEITGKNHANYYVGSENSTDLADWNIRKLDNVEDICEVMCVENVQEVSSPKDILNCAYSMLFGDTDLETVFEETRENVYHGKEGTQFENTSIMIERTNLTYIIPYEKGGVTYYDNVRFGLGSEPIEIPQFLKDALENGGEEKQIFPVEILEAWENSDAKIFTMIDNLVVNKYILNSDIISIEFKREEEVELLKFYERVGNDVNEYMLNYTGVWEADTWENVMGQSPEYENMRTVLNSEINSLLSDGENLNIVKAACNLENMTYSNGEYIGKSGTPLENYKILVSENEIKFVDTTYDFEFSFTIGSNAIVIPQEAKDALENKVDDTIPNSISEFVQKWIDSKSKYMIEDGGSTLKVYNNLCHVVTEDFEFYSEINDSLVIQWISPIEEGTDRNWNVTAAEYDNKMDIVNAAWPGSISGFFDYDQYFTYQNGVYIGSGERFENTTIEITATTLIIKENDVITTELIIGGVESFEIPEEIRNLYNGTIA